MNYAESPIAVAQTNLQLYRQMAALGYTADEVAAVASAYLRAVPWFSAQYRGNGKPFIAHLVGTASLLVSRRAPLAQVLAGLLHAAYQAGDLDVDPGRRQTPARREAVRALVGGEAEELVARYDATDWKGKLAEGKLRDLALPDELARGATYIFLANALEDFLDGGMCGLAGTRKSAVFTEGGQREVIALANEFDWPELAVALQAEFDLFNSAANVVPELTGTGYSATVLPPSASRTLTTAVASLVARARRRFRRLLRR